MNEEKGNATGLEDLDAAIANTDDPIVWCRVDYRFWTFVVDLNAGKVVKRGRWSYWFEVDLGADDPEGVFATVRRGPLK